MSHSPVIRYSVREEGLSVSQSFSFSDQVVELSYVYSVDLGHLSGWDLRLFEGHLQAKMGDDPHLCRVTVERNHQDPQTHQFCLRDMQDLCPVVPDEILTLRFQAIRIECGVE